MGKHESYQSGAKSKRKEVKVHPIWRGIGFVYIILMPFLSFLASIEIIKQNNISHWFAIPRDLYVPREDLLFAVGDPLLYVKLIITFCLVCVLFAIFMLLTFLINSMFGSSRYGAYDLPPLSLPKGVHKSKAR